MSRFFVSCFLFLILLANGRAVIFDSTGDSTFNATAPTGAFAGSGWQYEGLWGSFLGTPIAPQFFITAGHVGGSVGDAFTFGGVNYTTTAFFQDPNSDLRIWQVAGTFSNYAPLYSASDEAGENLVVIGRGTQRGAEILSNNSLRGWSWGTSDGVERWGTNQVSSTVNGGASLGSLLYATFDHGFSTTEATLSTGDSGGGVFIQDLTDNTWKLAGINYAVTGPYSASVTGSNQFYASLFNQRGFYVQSSSGGWTSASGPGAFYATRISSDQTWINSVISQSTAVPEPSTNALMLLGGAAFAGIVFRKIRKRG